MLSVLCIGDIVGRPGRNTLGKVLPEWKELYQPDMIICNGENLAGGKGLTRTTIKELQKLGVDLITGGNHSFDNPDGVEYLKNCFLTSGDIPVIRPANYHEELPGRGFTLLTKETSSGVVRLLVISLMGMLFIRQHLKNPFYCIDKILNEIVDRESYDICIVDFHAEATSEKMALRWYLDGRVAAVLGTHTHVPTNDCDISELGTAFQSDIGMSGSLDSCIGAEAVKVIEQFKTQLPIRATLEKKGRMQCNATLLSFDLNNKCKSIKALRKVLS